METLIPAEQTWWLWAVIVTGAALSIALEQRYAWGARLSGPVLALALAMVLTGIRCTPVEVLFNVPLLFGFCLTMALTNLVVTLLLGRVMKLPLEELLVSVNATLGGAPSAAAMAIAKGWNGLVLPGLLVGIWGYVIGTFLGIFSGQILQRWLGS